MRILVATDAWAPAGQRRRCALIERLARAVREFGVELSVLTPHEIPHRAAARPIPRFASPCQLPASRRRASRRKARRTSISRPKARSAGWRAAIAAPGAAVHDELPHALSRISRASASRFPRRGRLRVCAALPQCRARHDGGDAVARTRAGAPRLRACRCCGRAASITELFRPRDPCAASAPAPVFLYVGASRPRRTSRPSSTSICRDARWWSATARARASCGRRYPRSAFHRQENRRGARRRATPRPMSSSSRAVTDTFGMVLLEAMASGSAGRRLSRHRSDRRREAGRNGRAV